MAAPALSGVSGTGYYGSAGGSATQAVTGAMTTTAGRGMVAVLVGQDASSASFSDSKGNTWAVAGSVQLGDISGFSVFATIGYCANIATGGSGHTVTGTTGSDGYPTLVAFEVDQAITLNANTGQDVNASPWSSSITTTDNDTLAVAGMVFAGTSGWTLAASGWTWFGEVIAGATDEWDLGLLTRTAATAGSYPIAVTPTGGGTGTEATFKLAAFKAAAASGTNLTPGAAALTITGPAPTVTRTANVSLTPAAASLVLSRPLPTVARTAHQALQPGPKSLALQGYAPTVAQLAGTNLTPAAAALTLQGFAPTVARTAHVQLSPAPAQIVVSGHAPTVANGGAAPSGLPGIDYESGGAPRPRKVRQVSIKPVLERAREKRYPSPDAAPAYSQMKVDERTDMLIRAWAAAQGFASVADDLHVTLAYSSAPVDLAGVPLLDALEVGRRGRGMEQFGDAVVLTITSAELTAQWQAMRDAGASWDFPDYQPHITITYERGRVELGQVAPYAGPIVLLPEERSALDTGDTTPNETLAPNAVDAGLIEVELGALTPESVEKLAAKWQSALQLPVPSSADVHEMQYLQAVFALQRQREEAQRQLHEKRAKDDDDALSALLLVR